MSKTISTRRVVTVSFLVDVFDVISNLIVAILTGSAVIFAEMVQGATDSLGSFLLVIGERQARRPSDSYHPLGYTREVFFWALISSMVMLFLGSGLTIMRGYQQLIEPEIVRHKWLALAVLAISVLTNSYALSQSVRKIRLAQTPFLKAFQESSRQLVKTSLLRDSLGTLSALTGLIAIFVYDVAGILLFDALGAIVIGVFMAVFAIILISQAKSLITGNAVPKEILGRIKNSTLQIPEVVAINRLSAVFSGNEQILVDLDLDLKEDLTTGQIEKALDKIKEAIVNQVPEVNSVRVDLNSPTMREEVKIEKF